MLSDRGSFGRLLNRSVEFSSRSCAFAEIQALAHVVAFV